MSSGRQNVSNEELENAKHEIELCVKQILEIVPSAYQIMQEASKDDTVIEALLYRRKTDQWTEQYTIVFFKIITAQKKYINLLERKIGA
jgi:hypothetical protein